MIENRGNTYVDVVVINKLIEWLYAIFEILLRINGHIITQIKRFPIR